MDEVSAAGEADGDRRGREALEEFFESGTPLDYLNALHSKKGMTRRLKDGFAKDFEEHLGKLWEKFGTKLKEIAPDLFPQDDSSLLDMYEVQKGFQNGTIIADNEAAILEQLSELMVTDNFGRNKDHSRDRDKEAVPHRLPVKEVRLDIFLSKKKLIVKSRKDREKRFAEIQADMEKRKRKAAIK